MKFAVLFCFVLGVLRASPGRYVTSYETLFRTGVDGYATFLIEDDNRGSYYVSERKHTLVKYRYVESEGLGKKVSENYVITDVEESANGPYKIQHKVLDTDHSVSLASVLAEYNRSPRKVPSKTGKMITFVPEKGFYLNHFCLVKASVVNECLGLAADEKIHWELRAVYDGDKSYLLSISTGDEQYFSRIISLNIKTSRRVRQLLESSRKQVIYQRFDDLEEAMTTHKEWALKSREEFKGINFDLWEEERDGERSFVIVDRQSEYTVKRGLVEANAKRLGVKMEIGTNEFFVEKLAPVYW